MQFKAISYLELWQPFCWAECNNWCNFGRGYCEEQFCETFLNLGHWLRRKWRLKEFLFGALTALLFCGAKPFMQFWKVASWGTFMWSYMKFGPVVQEEMLFKDISYLEFWQPLCSVDLNHLCNFERSHEERSCEIILNLDQWFRRKCRLKVFYTWSTGSHFVQRSITICAILREGIMMNNSVNLFWIWLVSYSIWT